MKTAGKPTRKAKPSSTRKKPAKKKAKSKIILTSLAVGAVGILGYLAWQFYTRRKVSKRSGSGGADLMTILPSTTAAAIYPSSTSTSPINIQASVPLPKPLTQTTTASKGTSSFPLKKGNKNELVKSLQLALIAKYGASILPKYGADGDFGSETATALAKAGLPAAIDESTYYVIVQGSSSATDKSTLASKFLTAAANGDFNGVLGLLKQMKTKEDYRQVSDVFVQLRLRGVRQTLVNGLLSSFTSESQKQQIRYEFIRMGLKYNGTQWSLDGFDGRPIVTTEATNVWINATDSVGVQGSVVLGAEVTRKLDYTLFENNGRHFLVATKSIRYL